MVALVGGGSMDLKHRIGFHDWKPQPQTFSDYAWGYRTWRCACGKEETRKETAPDDPGEVMDRIMEEIRSGHNS